MKGLLGGYESLFPRGFRSRECIYADTITTCLSPGAEDRFKEAVYFASQIESGYHDPQKFRYSLGGFLAAYGSISEILQKELEHQNRWRDWKIHRDTIATALTTNEYAPALIRARNINIHQKSVFDGSVCQIGLYRGRRPKLWLTSNIDWDVSSPELLDRLWDSEYGQMMLDPEHSAIGEQYGVQRTYKLREISDHLPIDDKDLDILQIARRALLRTYDTLGATHTMDGEVVGLIDGGAIVNDFTYSQVTICLESDVNPDLLRSWDWPDLDEALKPVPNF